MKFKNLMREKEALVKRGIATVSLGAMSCAATVNNFVAVRALGNAGTTTNTTPNTLDSMETITIDPNVGQGDPFAMMWKLIGVLLTIMQVGGAGLFIWGTYELVMGMTQDGQADKKMKGLFFMGGGAILVALKFILKGLHIIQVGQ